MDENPEAFFISYISQPIFNSGTSPTIQIMNSKSSESNLMKELIINLDKLTALLKVNHKESYKFFEHQKERLIEGNDNLEALKPLKTSNSIVQYADFTFEEERLYNEMYDALEKVSRKL